MGKIAAMVLQKEAVHIINGIDFYFYFIKN